MYIFIVGLMALAYYLLMCHKHRQMLKEMAGIELEKRTIFLLDPVTNNYIGDGFNLSHMLQNQWLTTDPEIYMHYSVLFSIWIRKTYTAIEEVTLDDYMEVVSSIVFKTEEDKLMFILQHT